MSIISDLKSKVTGAPAPADINFMLSQAQDVLDHLQDDYGSAALGAIDNPAGQKALDELKSRIVAQRDRIADLKAALVTAERQANELMLAQRKSLQKSQFLACSKHLDLRDDAARDYQTAIEAATVAYRKMQVHSVKAQAACPLTIEWPGSFNENDLMLLARGEAWKHVTPPEGGKPANWDGYGLPGVSAGDAAYIGNPAGAPPIADELAKDSARLKSLLKAKLIP